jgi:hypothetical protein
MTTQDIRSRLQSEKKLCYLGIFGGVVVTLISLWVGFAARRQQQVWSSRSIASIQKEIEQAYPSQENLHKISIAFTKHANQDAQQIQDMLKNSADILFSVTGVGALMFVLSLKELRLIHQIQLETNTKESELDIKPESTPE